MQLYSQELLFAHHLPVIYQLEHDEDVLEFYDQPPQIKLEYQGNNGRKLGVLHTPDLFVIRTNSAGWEECKTEQDLKKLAQKNSNRYFLSEDGQWHCPPGEHYANQFGFYYCVRSDSKINWVLQRNILFLEDYYRAESLTVEESVVKSVLSLVSAQPCITLAELLNHSAAVKSDHIYTLIASEQLYLDLNAVPLAEPDRCLVFCDRQTAIAYGLMVEPSNLTIPVISPVIDIAIGTTVSWDGKGLNIIHVGETEIVLGGQNNQLIELKKPAFENLVRQGKIKSIQTPKIPTISSESWQRFYQASPEDQAEALRRYKAIEPYLNITLKDLQKRAWSVAQCQRMFKEIQEGERQLSETETDVQNLRFSLGLGGKPVLLPEEATKTSHSQGKVGKRKPKRDPIGVQQDVS